MTPLLSAFGGASARGFGFSKGTSSVFPARYFIFQPISIKGGGDPYIQLGEFNIMNGGSRITSANYYAWNLSFSSPGDAGASNYPSNETPSMANDGTTSTKWLDFRGVGGGLYMDLLSPTTTTGYQIYTANDGPHRDPSTWKVWASKDNTTWALVSEVSNAGLTDSRYAYAGTWNWIAGT